MSRPKRKHKSPTKAEIERVEVSAAEIQTELEYLLTDLHRVEAICNASVSAVNELPFPRKKEHRQAYDRLFALVYLAHDELHPLIYRRKAV